jgi:hypothetical protein
MIGLAIVAMLSAAQAAPAPPAAGAEEQMICKKRAVTGSRTRFEKTCMTERQWRHRREDLFRVMRESNRGNAAPPPPGTDF